jgi:hypothetical protein
MTFFDWADPFDTWANPDDTWASVSTGPPPPSTLGVLNFVIGIIMVVPPTPEPTKPRERMTRTDRIVGDKSNWPHKGLTRYVRLPGNQN